jgi:hypothetical protein
MPDCEIGNILNPEVEIILNAKSFLIGHRTKAACHSIRVVFEARSSAGVSLF